MEQHKMSILNSSMTRTKAYREAVSNACYEREAAAEKSAKQAEYQHFANRRSLDDDEFRAACGIGSTNFGTPPRRRGRSRSRRGVIACRGPCARAPRREARSVPPRRQRR